MKSVMDSKSPNPLVSNLEVASNVWAKLNGEEASFYEAAHHVPGDLRAHLQGTSDKRILVTVLNAKQMEEYLAYKFFLTFGVNTDLRSKSLPFQLTIKKTES